MRPTITHETMARRPFTLLEVVVAMLLLGFVVAVLFMGTHAVLTSWEQLETYNVEFQERVALDRTFDRILSNAVPFRWPDDVEDGDRREYLAFVGEPEALTVATLHEAYTVEDGALRFCRFEHEDDRLVVYYTNRPPFPEDLDDRRVSRSVLAHGVTRLGFLYASWEDGRIVFIDDWEDRDYMPLAILIQLEWEDGGSENWLRRTAGSSYFESWGKRDPEAVSEL
jgi:hypothetical protein